MERKYGAWYEFLPIIFGIFVFLVGYVVLKYSPNIASLYVSTKTPWGVITAMFIDDGAANGESYAFLAFLFIAANAAYSRSLRVGRYLVSIGNSLAAGLVANLVNLVLFVVKVPNGYSLGQSGIVYGFWGTIGIMAFSDLFMYAKFFFRKIRKKDIRAIVKNRTGGRVRMAITYVFTIILFLFTFVYVFADLPAFFSFAPGVDSFVHIISFGAGGMMTLYVLYRHWDQLFWATDSPKRRTV